MSAADARDLSKREETTTMTERNMSYARRAARGSMASARAMRDPSSALYWAFVAGQQAAGHSYVAAKQEEAALGLVPTYLQDSAED